MTPPAANVIHCLRSALGTADGGPTDAALLQRFAKSRDQEAFELLVWRHAGMVLRVCRSRLRDHHAAEDASQAVFLALARQATVVNRRGTVAGWLYRVAWRVAAKAARRRLPQVQAEFDQLPAVEAEPPRDPALLQALNEEIARLPEKYRVPLLLCYFEGLTQADAAQRLGWPIGTLATRIARAKSRVQQRLTRRGVAVPVAGFATLIVADAAPAFVNSTVRAAVAFVTGNGASAIPTSVLQLAQGAIRTMTLTKLRWAAGIVAACGAMTFGIAWAAGTTPALSTPDDTAAAAPPAAGSPDAVEPRDGKPEAAVRNATSTQRHRSLNNLKQLLIAMHNYHDVHGYFPGDIRDKDGKALLSWRVVLLPYLEQDSLYKTFRLDQPWDSEHNLKLLDKMPPALRVGIEPKNATHTYYQVFAGPGTPFGPSRFPAAGTEGGAGGSAGGPPPGAPSPAPMEGSTDVPAPKKPNAAAENRIKIAHIADGTSNTLGIVEAGPPVPWTKPADFSFDPKKSLPKLDGPFANALHVAMLDGTSHSLKRNIDATVLRNMIMMDDGNPIPDLKTLAAPRPVETAEDRAVLRDLLDRNQKLIEESERLVKDHIELLKKKNATVKDLTEAEEQAEQLQQVIAGLREMNRKLKSVPPKADSKVEPKAPAVRP